jgi:alkanesulfonate monooxygenase SsuD/methylene tetrahydromethanopterin reductase-like flavin-dependent oxidoreductase (luciferase family)
MNTPSRPVSFGIVTAPQLVDYQDILRVWREADTVEAISHAWLFDHLLPIGGADKTGPIFEGWTLLSALAAQTQRLRLGLLVTSNRIRPPALLAKIAATIDVVSDGRLDLGIGVGSRAIPGADGEYLAHGLPYVPFKEAVAGLDEACTIIRRLWTEDVPFNFDGACYQLTGAFSNPKPVQHPGPPLLIAGRAAATLRVVAAHADIWNIPGGDIQDCIQRSGLLDRYCAEIGRDPEAITRSIHLRVSYEAPDSTRAAILEATDAGFTHITLGVPAPYPENVAHWIAREIISPTR